MDLVFLCLDCTHCHPLVKLIMLIPGCFKVSPPSLHNRSDKFRNLDCEVRWHIQNILLGKDVLIHFKYGPRCRCCWILVKKKIKNKKNHPIVAMCAASYCDWWLAWPVWELHVIFLSLFWITYILQCIMKKIIFLKSSHAEKLWNKHPCSGRTQFFILFCLILCWIILQSIPSVPQSPLLLTHTVCGGGLLGTSLLSVAQ